MSEIISYEHAIREELLFEMANVSRNVTGLPYELWIDSHGKDRQTTHNEPRIKIKVDGQLIPVLISENPDIPDSVKKQGISKIPKFEHVQKYIRAYYRILLAHYNREINDTQALSLLGSIKDAKNADIKLQEITSYGDLRIEFEWLKDEELFLIEVRDDVNVVEYVQALTESELFEEIGRLQRKYKCFFDAVDRSGYFQTTN